MADSPEKPVRVTGAEAKRIKRHDLGIADRRKQHSRPAGPMKGSCVRGAAGQKVAAPPVQARPKARCSDPTGPESKIPSPFSY